MARGRRIGWSEGRGQGGQRVEEPKRRAECYSEMQELKPCDVEAWPRSAGWMRMDSEEDGCSGQRARPSLHYFWPPRKRMQGQGRMGQDGPRVCVWVG